MVREPNPREDDLPVVVRGLTVAYRHRPVLRDVSLSLPPGRLIGVIGPNGAGKSTMIKAILGLVPRLSGEVRIFGRPAARARREVAYVPQRASVDWDFPTDVLDVVMMGRYGHLGLLRRPGPRERDLAMDALEKVGMADFAHRQISQLSGGQQQRVFLARALAQGAPLMVLDEPFNAVEEGAQAALVEALSLLRSRGVAVMISTHDLDFVAGSHWFDRVLVLNGRLLAYGPPDRVCARPGGGSPPASWPEPVVCGGRMAP